jgi:LysM repeat protein
MYRRISLVVLLGVASFAPDAAAQSLRGSRASVDLMYRQARNHGLHFYETASGVRKAADRGEFVRLRGNANYQMGSVSHPYVLPSTATFVERLSAQYRAACGEKLVVTSAIRPKSQRLANSTSKTVHPTGMAIDLRKPTRGRCLSWLRETLSHLDAAGAVEATEEYRPPHFHVAVFPKPYERYVSGRGGVVRLAASDAPARAEKAEEPSASARTYKVRRGDSLWTIARRNRVSVDRIKSANDLRSSRIKAGQVLLIPETAR